MWLRSSIWPSSPSASRTKTSPSAPQISWLPTAGTSNSRRRGLQGHFDGLVDAPGEFGAPVRRRVADRSERRDGGGGRWQRRGGLGREDGFANRRDRQGDCRQRAEAEHGADQPHDGGRDAGALDDRPGRRDVAGANLEHAGLGAARPWTRRLHANTARRDPERGYDDVLGLERECDGLFGVVATQRDAEREVAVVGQRAGHLRSAAGAHRLRLERQGCAGDRLHVELEFLDQGHGGVRDRRDLDPHRVRPTDNGGAGGDCNDDP